MNSRRLDTTILDMNPATENKQCRTCGIDIPERAALSQCERCTTTGELLLSHFSSPPAGRQPASGLVREEGIDFGDYVLLNEIARGGMGSVYRARQKSLNRLVAVKRPLPGVAADPERVRRFRTEAESVAGLSHPNIIPVFESGEWNGEQFFSMAYVEGESLSEVLRRRAPSPAQAAQYVKKIALAIHHAHQRGVLHRDLKPANIIVDAQNEPLVADFGIACLLRGNEGEESDKIIGTANYMAPEQIQPGTKPLSVATDVYALGGILYHLLTGKPPFDGDNRDQIYWSAYYEDPAPPSKVNPNVPRDLEAICLKALEKHPDQRYSSALAMAEDLERFEHRRPVLARPVSLPVRCWMWTRRNRVATGLLAILVAAVAIGIGAQMVSIQRIRSARAASEGFIGFMSQDLADDLRYVGRLDLMEKINARAEDYYTNYTALGDAGYMERKARFFENSASTEEDLGHLVRADAFAVEAERIYESQGRLAPSDGRWKRLLSRVRVLRLNIAKAGGLRTAAYAQADAAVLAASEALALNPTDFTNQANLGKVLLAQADFWVLQGRAEVSATNVAKADKLLREATRSPAADPEWLLSLVTCDYYRARISQLRKAHETALEKFTEYLGNLQELAARFPRNTKWQFELAIAHSHVAGALTQLEQYAQAQPYAEAFERAARTLTSLDPRNATWLSLYGKSLGWRGVVDDTLHPKSTNGLHYLNLALSIQNSLLLQNPDWEQWAVNAEETTKAILARHQRDGRIREARELSADWLRQCEERALNAPNHVGHQLRWGNAVAADVRLNSRDEEGGRQTERMRAALDRFATLVPGQATVLAKARVIAAVGDSLDRGGDPAAAAAEVRKALDLRLAFFASAPRSARTRDFMIGNNFLYMAVYHLRARQNREAVAVAEEALNWAGRNLTPDDSRRDLSQLCWVLTQKISVSDPEFGKVRELVQRCIVERFSEPPPLSRDDETNVGRLRDWIAAHP